MGKGMILKMKIKIKLLMCIILFFAIGLISSNESNAVLSNKLKFYNNLIPNKNIATISLYRNNRNTISVSRVIGLNSGINEIYDKKNNPRMYATHTESDDRVATGYKILCEGNLYDVVVYGDVNGDGIVCDIDDIMCLINAYLGKRKLTDMQMLAGNLQNNDNRIDIDDIMIMINTFLRKDAGVPKKNVEGELKVGTEKLGVCYLNEVVEVGDIIEWGILSPEPKNIEWVVWKNDGKNVSIIPTYNFSSFTESIHKQYCDIYEQNSSSHYKGEDYNYSNNVFSHFVGQFSNFFIKSIVKESRYPTLSEYEFFKNNTSIKIRRVFYKYLADNFAVLKNINGRNEPVSNIGEEITERGLPIRPVYVLKDNVEAIYNKNAGCWIIYEW